MTANFPANNGMAELLLCPNIRAAIQRRRTADMNLLILSPLRTV
jgi:hypothetical protein